MFRSVWNTNHESVCSLNFYNGRDIQFFRSSGFKYNNYLVCDSCQEIIEKARYLIIQFPSKDPDRPKRSIRLSVNEFRDRLSGNIEMVLPGILLMPLEFDEFKEVPSVKCMRQTIAEIGTSVAILSYSHKVSQLYMKTGLISSQLDIRGEKYFKLIL